MSGIGKELIDKGYASLARGLGGLGVVLGGVLGWRAWWVVLGGLVILFSLRGGVLRLRGPTSPR